MMAYGPAKTETELTKFTVNPGGHSNTVKCSALGCDFCEDWPPPFGTPLRNLPKDSAERKKYPIGTGLLDYFPDACAEVAHVSWVGNEKHNHGEPLHHARGKSMDHADCMMRHYVERGGYDIIVIDGVEYKVRHSAALAWRAMAALQEELEKEKGLPLPRGAK